jgi:hypothetical protein
MILLERKVEEIKNIMTARVEVKKSDKHMVGCKLGRQGEIASLNTENQAD